MISLRLAVPAALVAAAVAGCFTYFLPTRCRQSKPISNCRALCQVKSEQQLLLSEPPRRS
jgi:hypothetical protein